MGRGSFAAGISRDALKAAGYEVTATRRTAPNAGKRAEDALYRWLDILGIPYVPQYRWGAELEPPRKFHSDAAIPAARLLIEIDGGVHGIGEKRARDLERQNLGVLAGWRFLRFQPEQARDGTASLFIQRFLEVRHGDLPRHQL